MDLGLADRVVIVTGGSRGIGRAAALAFARERAHVLLTYRNDASRAEALAADLRRGGTDAVAVCLDLGARESIFAAITVALDRWGRIDVLVNNAVQWGTRGPFE